MSYMPERIKQHNCTAERGALFLNVGTWRAGRAVADAQEHLAQDALPLNVIAAAMVRGSCDRVIEVVGWPGVLGAHHLAPGEYILDDAAEYVAIEEADETQADAGLVRWFVEQQAAAAASHVGRAAPTADPASEGELILARSGGLRSRAWRGGGTMRRR